MAERYPDPAVLDRPVGEVERDAPSLLARAVHDWRSLLVLAPFFILAIWS